MVDAHDDEVYSAKNSRLIWIDCEMTGLDIFHDELCEISVVPTDFEPVSYTHLRAHET